MQILSQSDVLAGDHVSPSEVFNKMSSEEVADFFQQQGKLEAALDDYSATVDASFYEQVE